jgi:hypothetical protein
VKRTAASMIRRERGTRHFYSLTRIPSAGRSGTHWVLAIAPAQAGPGRGELITPPIRGRLPAWVSAGYRACSSSAALEKGDMLAQLARPEINGDACCQASPHQQTWWGASKVTAPRQGVCRTGVQVRTQRRPPPAKLSPSEG